MHDSAEIREAFYMPTDGHGINASTFAIWLIDVELGLHCVRLPTSDVFTVSL